MRALVLSKPRVAEVVEVAEPEAVPGEVVVEVERVGLCGTDVELFNGEMAYVLTGEATYPLRPGHEWCGTVVELGSGVDAGWLGAHVAADTMLGCGTCARCLAGRHHVCSQRSEIGIRGGRAGALAERIAVPASALVRLPDDLPPAIGAFVEPAGSAVRAVRAAEAGPGRRILVLGPGTIGLLVALFARVSGAEVHLLGPDEGALGLVRDLGFDGAWTAETLPRSGWDAVVDASTDPTLPAEALRLVEPGGRVVLVGIAVTPSLADLRELVFRDVTVVGLLAGCAGLAEAVERFASGEVDPSPLVSAVVGLEQVGSVLAGNRPVGRGTKVHVVPRG